MAGTKNFTSFLDTDNLDATGNSSLPVRAAPPIPSQGNKTTNKQTFVRSKQTSTEDKRGSNRGSKKMFFRRKSYNSSTMPVLKNSNSNSDNTNGNQSKVTSDETNKKKSKWTTPTIIRPLTNSKRENIVRKKVPPRPPPPKINKSNGCISVFPLDPPSYEEVLRADINNRGVSLNKQRPLKGPAPPTPVMRPSNSLASAWPAGKSFTTVDLSYPLIDLSLPEPIVPQSQSSKAISGDLLELDEIFSKMSGPTAEKDNGWSFSSTQDEDTYKFLEIQSHQSNDNALFSSQKPIPKPRTSLKNNSLGLFHDSDDFDGPALPPRPNLKLPLESSEFSSSTENNVTSSSPPPLPPRPKNYCDSEQESDDLADLSSQRTEPHGIALYDYAATQSEDLPFKVSDVITLIHRINDEWFYGCLGEKEGMFPRNFIQIVIPLPDDPEFLEDNTTTMTGPRCLTLFDFTSDRDDELSFNAGEMIRLVARISDHWLKGIHKDKIGLIPSNFVRIIEDLKQDSDTLTEAFVQYDFHAENPLELSCKVGDVINIIYPIDSDWILARNKDKEGLIPWKNLDFSH